MQLLFVGGGFPIYQAAKYALDHGQPVQAICCQMGDHAIPVIRKAGLAVLETDDPNALLPRYCDNETILMSINNKKILADQLLSLCGGAFNIHGGLSQKYRGVAPVCIFAALCRGEDRYGVTLHEILPAQKVDVGPVVAQISFAISTAEGFSDVLERCLAACQRIFEQNLLNIASRNHDRLDIKSAEKAYSYRDVARLCVEAKPENLNNAMRFGYYSGYLSKLQLAIEGFLEASDS